MLEVIESKSTISIKTNIEFIKKNCNSDDVLYENENILVTPKKIQKLFNLYGVERFGSDELVQIKVSSSKRINKFRVANKKLDSISSLKDCINKDSLLIKPIFLKSLHLSNLVLKPYQIIGVNWLLEANSRILADDMGLGKTLQSLSACAKLISDSKIKSVLIICPTSLVYNWCYEINKWLPEFTVNQITNTGPDTKKNKVWEELFNSAHFIVSSYDHLRTTPEILNEHKVDLIIADEAHKLRKASSKIHKSIKLIDRKIFWALSGTPIENKSSDLINILSLIDRSIDIRSLKKLTDTYLSVLAEDYILRRLKKDVLKELNNFTENTHYLKMKDNQELRYLSLQRQFHRGPQGERLKIFGELIEVCDLDEISKESIKIDYSLELIEKIIQSNEKCVIFSFWLKPLNELKARLDMKFHTNLSSIFDGSLDKDEREKVLKKFKEEGNSSVLLCSAKIAGEGLNLTEANHVIFINNWWNPSNNTQARDRVVRIGQTKECFIHHLKTVDTIEERIEEIIDEKQTINENIIEALAEQI